MGTVALKPLAIAPTPDGYSYYDAIGFVPGSPPPRPHPIPLPPDGAHPSHPIALPGDPWWEGRLPEPTASWHFTGGEQSSGWYFIVGPFDKPRPLSGDNVALDPALTQWSPCLDGMGWRLVSGPYDKPFPIFGTEPPDPVDPPEEPPVSEGCRWRYSDAGWVLVCGPYPKPKPPGGGE